MNNYVDVEYYAINRLTNRISYINHINSIGKTVNV